MRHVPSRSSVMPTARSSATSWTGRGRGSRLKRRTGRRRALTFRTLMSARGLAPKTVERYRSSLSTLWNWLEEKGMADVSNPWARHRSIRPSVQTKRKPLTDEQLVSLLSGSYDTPTYRQVLADLVRLALVTGCRLEELCALKKSDVVKRKDGYWIVIREGKTEAAAREVPIHFPLSIMCLIAAAGEATEERMAVQRGHTRSLRTPFTSRQQGIRALPQAGRRERQGARLSRAAAHLHRHDGGSRSAQSPSFNSSSGTAGRRRWAPRRSTRMANA